MPYAGRGGAGNIEAATKALEAKAQDLEANNVLQKSSEVSVPVSPVPQQEYAYTGRGGAGNYYSPSVLSQSGTFSTTFVSPDAANSTSTTTSQRRKSSVSSPSATTQPLYSGRGGAGNYRGEAISAGLAEGEAKSTAEQEIKAQVERDVEAGLAKPAVAWLGGREADAGMGFPSLEPS